MVNNYDWTASLSTIDFLRDIGKHFPVNRMLGREVVRSRLEAGISYTEFSYVLLQSMDYLEPLPTTTACRLQTGGSDQWGNITAGVELIRRVEGERVHALATPLVTKADGTKFGKTETGSIWLDAAMTSPYAFYQFWFNADDARRRQLPQVLHVPVARRDRGARAAGRARSRSGARHSGLLADDVTTLTHGAAETERVKAAAAALFGGGDLHALDAATLDGGARARRRTSTSTGHGELPTLRRPVRRDRAGRRARARRGGRWPRAARTSTTCASPMPRRGRPTTTCCRAAGCCSDGQAQPRRRQGRADLRVDRAMTRWIDGLEAGSPRLLPEPVAPLLPAGLRRRVHASARP